ncbi:transmembrane protein [Jimgerdemannia flammicorona]|uniref:Magnesium-transporting ATPase, P-type 1 n=1 Tax=Jimgerdemannia flammicorona TaxID=994334 RepID=A0A433DBV2_9FUNG|nr:transmembrane protein [Jimgerdemannia flammicorona]
MFVNNNPETTGSQNEGLETISPYEISVTEPVSVDEIIVLDLFQSLPLDQAPQIDDVPTLPPSFAAVEQESHRRNVLGGVIPRAGTEAHVIGVPSSNPLSPPKQMPRNILYPIVDLKNRLLGRITEKERSSEAESRIGEALKEYSRLDPSIAMTKLASSYNGLTSTQVSERLLQYGPNLISSVKPPTWYKLLFQAIVHPFNILLTILAVISVTNGDPYTCSVMLIMVVLSSALRFFQEMKSTKAFTSLRELVKTHVTVIRRNDGTAATITDSAKSSTLEIPLEEVVPGDIVSLSAGDLFPGDVRLLESKDLFVSQSALTGEFMPVEKLAAIPSQAASSVFDAQNICLMSTNVVSGLGVGIVLSTGDNTYISTISTILSSSRSMPSNAFEKGIRRVSYLLLLFMVIMVPIVIVVSGFVTKDWKGAAFFGISVAVGLTPEMLPMILNANLARGATEMARKKTIVKRLDAIQNMGAMDVLCSDKTGTLTQDEVVLMKYLDSHGDTSIPVLKHAYLNSTFQTGLKNLLDHAVINYGNSVDLGSSFAITDYKKIDELPFDFVRRRMSVILERGGKYSLICKGAMEELLEICSKVREAPLPDHEDDNIVPMTPEYRNRLLVRCEEMNADGLRVLAVASRELFPSGEFSSDYKFNVEADERDLTFHGFLAFLDPPKESVPLAIQDFSKYGVTVKVLTGDNLPVAKKVCRDVGIDTQNVITGPQLEALSSEEFHETVERCTLFAKLTPIQKLDIVNSLKSQNHTVGFLGDGINDALALRGADVGISVESGTNIAKDASDIILLEKSLQVVTTAIIRGRITHGNTIKYIKMAASSNFGNVFSILIASAWLPFVPMLPLQLLVQNLLYDFSQIAIPWDTVDEEFLLDPHPWKAKSIGRFMLFLGPTSSVFDMFTFSIMWFYFGWQDPDTRDQFYFQTGWFIEGLLTQTLIVHMIRTEKLPFIQRNATWPVILGTTLVVAAGIIIPYTPLGYMLSMEALPGRYFPFLVCVLVGYFSLTQCIKYMYIKLFKEWL